VDGLMILADNLVREPFLQFLHRQDRRILGIVALPGRDRAVCRARQKLDGSHLRPDEPLDMATEMLFAERAVFDIDPEVAAGHTEIPALELCGIVDADSARQTHHGPRDLDSHILKSRALVEYAVQEAHADRAALR
jgi:hypothetical protein